MHSIDSILRQYTDASLLPQKGSSGVIILSGGMDSVTLLHFLVKHLGCSMRAISFDYGQKHAKEIACAKAQCEELGVNHQVIALPFVGDLFTSALLSKGSDIPEGHYKEDNMKQTVVPNRNMIMSSIAVGYGQSTGASFLALGVHAGDHTIYPDCRESFIDALRKAVELSDWNPFTIYAPFQRMTKVEILEIGFQLSPPVDYAKTWTCYKGRDQACGKCGSCQERAEAFKFIHVSDPLLGGRTC
ncbi:7-cyano-7-deazaguanine synthase QueC [Candidatus Peribacteria bacterium]|nr:7-cyano-7-deazaguanine synthase QueC [Candidatus Peribacteria bacterium]